MIGSNSFRVEIQIVNNTGDATGDATTVCRRGEYLSIAELEAAFTDAVKGAGFTENYVEIAEE